MASSSSAASRGTSTSPIPPVSWPLTHVFISCPLAAGVWDWFAATWAAVTGDDAPPRSADLLLADDTRIWGPPRQLRQLWHRLRLATICQLWAAYQRSRRQPDAAAIRDILSRESGGKQGIWLELDEIAPTTSEAGIGRRHHVQCPRHPL